MNTTTTLARTVAETAARTPDGAAVVDADRTLTWAGLEAEAKAMAAELAALDPSAPVLLLLPQLASSVSLMAAASVAGLDAVALAGFHGVERAKEFLEDLDGGSLVTPGPGGTVEVLATREATPRQRSGDPDPALCILTSGSTGRPKAVHHTWETLSAGARRRPHLEGARWLIGYPMPQFAGMCVVVQAVTSAGTLVLARDFSPAATREALVEQEVVYLSCTPSFARQLLFALEPEDWAAATLRHITMGGEIVDQELLDGLRGVLPDTRITHTYGASEIGALIWVQDYVAGFSAELLDGERFKVEDGELVVRRSSRAGLGYVGGAPRTDDWLTTGDLVEVRGDRVHFVGRQDDVINVAGFKVNPAAVAAVIRELPEVLDVSVLGQSSSVVGNLVKALVYTRPGTDEDALRRRIVEVCRQRFPPPMVPRLFEFVEGLRLSGAQKLLRSGSQ